MRALIVESPGSAPAIADIPAPTAAPGTVLIAVKAAGLNAIDAGIAAGYLAEMIPHEYPVGLGRDAAGVVLAVGDGVEGIAVGDEVVGHLPAWPAVSAGTIAEQAVVPAAMLSPKPSALSWEQAAAVPLAGATALQAVTGLEAQPGQTVLVSGATGGVGGYAVQLLAAEGVTVIATGTPTDAEKLVALGASHVVDYTAGDVAGQVRAIVPDGVDGLIELANHDPSQAPLSAVRAGGVVAATTGVMQAGEAVEAAGLRLFPVMAAATSENVAPLLARAADDELRIDLTEVLPFDRAVEGLAGYAPGGSARGKTVVRVAG
ncbi:MAG: NADP-dependent oxidoreductase [Candidatus Nanopelagicales bacterium]